MSDSVVKRTRDEFFHVIFGQLASPASGHFSNLAARDILGICSSVGAEVACDAKVQRGIDDLKTRYFVVHPRWLPDPGSPRPQR